MEKREIASDVSTGLGVQSHLPHFRPMPIEDRVESSEDAQNKREKNRGYCIIGFSLSLLLS
jgi:hypothetical protein